MSNDPTENIRRQLVAEQKPLSQMSREELTLKFGKLYNTIELQKEYEVLGFAAPFVIVCRKSDGAKGSFEFLGSPRFYYNFALD